MSACIVAIILMRIDVLVADLENLLMKGTNMAKEKKARKTMWANDPEYAKKYPDAASVQADKGRPDAVKAMEDKIAALEKKVADQNAADESEKSMTEEEQQELKIKATRTAAKILEEAGLSIDDIAPEEAGADGKLGADDARGAVEKRGLG